MFQLYTKYLKNQDWNLQVTKTLISLQWKLAFRCILIICLDLRKKAKMPKKLSFA